MGAQAPVAADMWRVPAPTLARPAPLESGATARFWNPAARAGGRGLNVGIQVFETSDAVRLSGLLVGVTRTLGRHLEVGIILGRLQIRDLVRTGTSPVAQLGTIPVYEQVGGATLAAGLGRVKSAVMIRGHDARFDQFREGGVTADIGVSFEITPRLTVAAATHFLPVDVQSRESTSYLAALEYVLWTPSLWGRRSSVTGRYGTTARDRGGLDHAFGAGLSLEDRLHIDATYHREADYASTVWRPAVEVSLRLGRYAISAARGGGANHVGGTFRVGLELDLSR